MRAFTAIVLAVSASLAAAQSTANAFNIPEGQSSYNVAAGGTVDLSWSNLEGSTVTIKLQIPGYITPDSGVVLAQSIQNTGSTTVQIPSSADIPPGAYTFEIINDADSNTYNFSPSFSVASASGTGSFGATATATGTSVTSASVSATTTGSESASSTDSSASVSKTSSAAASGSSAAASSTLTAAASSSTAASTTTAPNTNAGAKVQAPLAAAVMLFAAVFL